MSGNAVLIVDDDPDDLVALEATLRPLGLDVVTADDGEGALRHLLNRRFAVVVMDLVMPRLNGYETAAFIRQRDSLRELPILILSGLDKEGVRLLPGYAPDLELLQKPVVPETLRARVAECVARAEGVV